MNKAMGIIMCCMAILLVGVTIGLAIYLGNIL